jgi:hypothetical protein
MLYVDIHAASTATPSGLGGVLETAAGLIKAIVGGTMSHLGLAAGPRAFYVGGAALDLWQVRSTHSQKYPKPLFEPVTFLLAFGPTTPAEGAQLDTTTATYTTTTTIRRYYYYGLVG